MFVFSECFLVISMQ